jgi:hypothetical protein
MDIRIEGNSVVVTSNNVKVLHLDDFPTSELRSQLCNWLVAVTEENAKCFIFESTERNQTGSFRIEPRPNGWQFTSIKESTRSNELLSLQEWRNILNNVL